MLAFQCTAGKWQWGNFPLSTWLWLCCTEPPQSAPSRIWTCSVHKALMVQILVSHSHCPHFTASFDSVGSLLFLLCFINYFYCFIPRPGLSLFHCFIYFILIHIYPFQFLCCYVIRCNTLCWKWGSHSNAEQIQTEQIYTKYAFRCKINNKKITKINIWSLYQRETDIYTLIEKSSCVFRCKNLCGGGVDCVQACHCLTFWIYSLFTLVSSWPCELCFQL